MMKTKIYLSGKITGLDPDNVRLKFHLSGLSFDPEYYEVICPLNLPHNHDKSEASFLLEDLQALAACNCIYMLRDWTDSRGARIEHDFAVKVGIKVIYQESL